MAYDGQWGEGGGVTFVVIFRDPYPAEEKAKVIQQQSEQGPEASPQPLHWAFVSETDCRAWPDFMGRPLCVGW